MQLLTSLRHFLFVPSREFSTTAPVHFQLQDKRVSNLWGWKPLATFTYAVKKWRDQQTKIDINERIIEVPWVSSQLDFKKKGSVLDIGWLESTLPISLATAGFLVTGVDIREGELTHPNLETVVGDICTVALPKKKYDYVILLSTLEHIGLDSIYGAAPDGSSDLKAVRRCLAVLKPGGTLIITTPVAQTASQTSFMRIYTPARLRTMLSSAKKVVMEFYAPNAERSVWKKVSEKELPTAPRYGVALVTARA